MRPSLDLLMSAEFHRAIAAERRYEEMKYDSAAITDIPRRVYEEFYALDTAAHQVQRLRCRIGRADASPMRRSPLARSSPDHAQKGRSARELL
jgi:hypothetical protein